MSDEVSDFLRSVELLKERREEEDEARSRDLEEQILQDKRERQARRAERARSISPQKSSPVNTPSPSGHHRIAIQPSAFDGTGLESLSLESSGSPRPRAVPSDAMDSATDYSNSPTKENDSPFDSDIKRTSLSINSPSIGMPSARSPLSWQRRPTSQASDRPKSRPLSMFAAENAARSSSSIAEPAPATDQTLSRDQIAQSLAGKDPSWFRQTADPGRGSGAFRKSQVEDQDTTDMPPMRTQLHGMTRDYTIEPAKESPTARPVTPTMPRLGSQLGSPLPLTGAPRLDPPIADAAGDLDTAAINRQSIPVSPGRTSPTRPPLSPTKGMGGFVQSAMMKRSDSVKRWSVSSPSGLQRADSVRSSMIGLESPQAIPTPKASARPKSMLREGSEPSAPTLASSHEKYDAEPEVEKQPTPVESTTPSAAEDKTVEDTVEEPEETTPPTSPSKTMDPRRWSPTKSSSWLEAALNKPESPKAKPTPAAPNQPAWMVELNKAKAQKSTIPTADFARSPSFPKKPEVKTGGLLRSTPMGSTLKPSALAGFPGVPSVSTADKPAISGLRGSLRKPSPTGESSPSETHGDAAPAAKAKPETPPKKDFQKDFRANLKHRAQPSEVKTTDSVDELKNVFGTLRRTKTQNYVAPDELKGNILRGKAALNLSGGPVKTERKDEFKEAILQKKDDFQKVQHEGRGVIRKQSSAADNPVPEAIAKKLVLQRTGTFSKTPTTPDFPLQSSSLAGSNRSSHISTSSRDISALASESALKPAAEIAKEPAAGFVARNRSESKVEPVINPITRNRAQSRVGLLADRFNPGLAGLIARGPSPGSGPSKSPVSSAGSTPTETGEPAKPGPKLTHMTKNRARGPRRNAPTSVAKPVDEAEEKAPELVAEPEKEPVVSPSLKKPVISPKPEQTTAFPKLEQEVALPKPKPVTSPKPEKFASPKPESTSAFPDFRKSFVQDKPKPLGDVISLVDSSKRASKDESTSIGQPITLVSSSSVKTRPRSPTKVHEQVAALAALTQQSPKPADTEAASQPSSPRKLNMRRMSKFLTEQDLQGIKPEPVKSRPASPVKDRFSGLASPPIGKQPGNVNPELKPALPIRSEPIVLAGADLSSAQPVTTRKPAAEEQPKVEQPKIKQPPQLPPISRSDPMFSGAGLGLSYGTTAQKPAIEKPVQAEQPPQVPLKGARPLPIRSGGAPFGGVGLGLPQPVAPPKPAVEEPEQRPQLPPKVTRPLPSPPTVTSPPRTYSPIRSPTKQASDASALINDFFGPERPRGRYTADAAEILTRRPVSTANVQTQRAQLFQLSSEGKRISVPSHYERVLFEREMYLCFHTYIDRAGKKVNEVYFWAGDEVPESHVDDAHLFAAREARSFGGKLIKLVQGKETTEFLQALGGIVIVRRGSSNKYDSLAPNMLCGRRYLGQIAFDEVDFSPLSLCSGFPYLITQQGKCYLWKGKGSDVEELGCARLVGMDLALMGELLEVEEGHEPDSFWGIFGGGTRPSSAEHWRLKPNYDKYCGRLFCASAADKHQITELSPFKQTDLLASQIYVLDAFFEMYIIVGARSQRQYAAFRNALDFAQEYAILAAGMEDRPFVPISTVVLEGIPRDLKSVFRKWRDGASPTVMHVGNGNGQVGRSGSGSGSVSGGGLRRARSLRVVPLNQALQALAE